MEKVDNWNPHDVGSFMAREDGSSNLEEVVGVEEYNKLLAIFDKTADPHAIPSWFKNYLASITGGQAEELGDYFSNNSAKRIVHEVLQEITY